MKALPKLVLSVVGVALLATPALAQRPQRHVHYPPQVQYQDPAGAGSYPNPQTRSGSAESVESGAMFNNGFNAGY